MAFDNLYEIYKKDDKSTSFKRIPSVRLDEIIQRHKVFMRSTNPEAAMKGFAELIMDEMEKLNKGKS